MFYDPRYTETEANLKYFKDRYEAILDGRPENWDKARPGNEFEETRKPYYEYNETQLIDVNDKLKWLSSKRE